MFGVLVVDYHRSATYPLLFSNLESEQKRWELFEDQFMFMAAI